MLITPITPNVTASPMAARISTEPSDRPKNKVSAQPNICSRNSVLASAISAASRTVASLSSAATRSNGPRISDCVHPPNALAAWARTVASTLARSTSATAAASNSWSFPSGSTSSRAFIRATPSDPGVRRKASIAARRCCGSALDKPKLAKPSSIRLRKRLLTRIRSRSRLVMVPKASPVTAASMGISTSSLRPMTIRPPSS